MADDGGTSQLAVIASVVSAFGATAFLTGALYNFGYFYSMDLNWLTYLSYKDHIATIVFFAGPVLVLAAVFYFCRRWKYLDRVARVLMVCAFALWWPETQMLFGGSSASRQIIVLLKYWSSFLVVGYLISATLRLIVNLNQKTTGVLGLAIIGLTIFIILYGNSSFQLDAARTNFETEITTAQADHSEQVHVLRSIDEGVFLIKQESPDEIVFVKKDEIKTQIKKLNPK